MSFPRTQDPSLPPQTYSIDQRQKGSIFKNETDVEEEHRYSSLYSTAVKRYFATIRNHKTSLIALEGFSLLSINFTGCIIHFSNKQVAQGHRKQFNYGYEQTSKDHSTSWKSALESMGG